MDWYLILLFFPLIAAIYTLIRRWYVLPKFRIVEYGNESFQIQIKTWFYYTTHLYRHGDGDIRFELESSNDLFYSLENAEKRIQRYYDYKKQRSKIIIKKHYPFSPATSSTKDTLLIEAGKLFMEGKEKEGYAVLDKIKEYRI